MIQPNKKYPKVLRVCLDFKGLNKVTMANQFTTPFVDEIINEVERHGCYPFTNGFSRYNQVSTSKQDHDNTTFITK